MNDILGDAYLQGIREGDGIPDLDGSVEFEKENWSGELGKIYTNGDTFTIEGIDGTFTLTFENGDPIVTGEDGTEYYGYASEMCYSFLLANCLRSDEMAEVAFAKLLYNL